MRFCALFAPAALGYANGQTLPDSVIHVRSTLGTLLESIRREVREADDGLQKTGRWCAGTLSELRAVPGRTSEMQMDLNERQAAASELQGMSTQIGADIELIHRTINETEDLRRVWLAEAVDQRKRALAPRVQGREAVDGQLTSGSLAIEELLDTKRTTLSSLKAERELVHLAQEEAQWQVAEVGRRLADRRSTMTAERGFVEVLAYGCGGQEMKAAASAAARAREASAAERAFVALGSAGGQPEVRKVELSVARPQLDIADDPLDKDFELDLLQMANLWKSDDELSLSDSSDASPQQLRAVPSQESGVREHVVPAPMGVRIAVDLAQIKSEGSVSGEHLKFCAREQEHNYLVLRLAGDLVRQSEAAIDAHSAAEMQLQDGLKELRVASEVLNSIVQHVTMAMQQEIKHFARMAEDRKFTAGILEQAVDVLDGPKQYGNLTQESNASNIVSLLTSVNVSCYQSVVASKGARNEAVAVAKDIVAKAGELSSARRAEATEMEKLRDEHVSQRGALAQTKEAYEAQVAHALIYLDKLKEECGSPASANEGQGRSAPMYDLEDAQPPPPNTTALGSLRGVRTAEAQTDVNKIVPLERAALGMNVASDSS